MSTYAFLFKYIIIGDSSVGKSCMLLQFLEKKFKIDHDTTIGVEFGSKILPINNRHVKLQVWDTAGQESFKSITRSYYRGSICCLLVYDVTNRESFENLIKWLEETKTYSNEKITIMLVGNKTDMGSKRVVSFDEGHEFAQKHDLLFLESSAKTAYNIDLVFQKTAEEILNKIDKKDIDAQNEALGIKIGSQVTEEAIQNQKQKKNKGCC